LRRTCADGIARFSTFAAACCLRVSCATYARAAALWVFSRCPDCTPASVRE
jgi:hypothetical protein